MTIKKRLFYSNLLMVVAPLLAFILASLIFGGTLRATLFSDSDELSVIGKSMFEVQKIIDDADIAALTESEDARQSVADKIAAHGFRLLLSQGGEVLFTNMSGREQTYAAGYFAHDYLRAGQTLLSTIGGNLFYSSVETDSSPLVFIAVGGETDAPFGITSAVSPVIITLVAAIASVVIVIILISLFLARRAVKKITIPLDGLICGAQRVAEGNLDEDIHCLDAEELERVCAAFNEMQRQLRENIKKNNIYEQDRKEMLAGISHDLRTPLTSIKSYVKGLQDGVAQTPEKQRDYLDIVYRKSNDMENLLNRLFLFSKLETGNMPFQFRSVNMGKYVVTLLDSIESELVENGAALTFDGAGPNLSARLDTEQMTRAITNILDNSVKYNPGRRVNIAVTLCERDGKIVLRLQDDGIGVSDKQLARLFDSFYRGDESRKNSAEGSGLGLAIAKNIVAAHGGRVFAENYNGLAIIIELPIETGIQTGDAK